MFREVIRVFSHFVCLFLCMFMFVSLVDAQTLNDMYNELSELKREQASISSKKQLTEGEINSLNNSMIAASNEIDRTRSEVEKASLEIKNSEAKIESKKEESKELLKFLQLSTGENVYLDYVLASEDYTDFVYRYSVVMQLTSYNDSMVSELEKLIDDLESKKLELAKKEKELQVKRSELAKKKSSLNVSLSEIREGYVDINEEIAALNKSISYYEKLGCKRNQDVSKCSALPYADGFKYPLKSGRISSGWGWRTYILNGRSVTDYHYGYDFAGVNEGTFVYAVAPGKVIAITYASKCGGNQVSIAHNVNGKNYTSKYVHLLSIDVSYGQVVSDTTVIGKVGGYSTSIRHGGYDRCTTGTHLHFGIADGHRSSGFDAYAFNPMNIFPKLTGRGSSFSAR